MLQCQQKTTNSDTLTLPQVLKSSVSVSTRKAQLCVVRWYTHAVLCAMSSPGNKGPSRSECFIHLQLDVKCGDSEGSGNHRRGSGKQGETKPSAQTLRHLLPPEALSHKCCNINHINFEDSPLGKRQTSIAKLLKIKMRKSSG